MSKALNPNKEDLVRIMCSQDSEHFDVKISKNDERFIDLISNGCFVCKSRLSIEAVGSDINVGTKSSSTAKVWIPRRGEKTQIQERKRDISKDLKERNWLEGVNRIVPISQEDWRNDYEGEEPYISAHISQLLPIKAMCLLIGDTLSKRTTNTISKLNIDDESNIKIADPMLVIATKKYGQSWKYNKTVETWLDKLRVMRWKMYISENKFGLTQRGGRPSAGFPADRDEPSKKFLGATESERIMFEEKSSKRFANTVIGLSGLGMNADHSSGALFTLGLIKFKIKKIEDEYLLLIGLTEKGVEFTRIENLLLSKVISKGHIIERKYLENKFSDAETRFFFKHCKENLPKEYECLITSIKYMKNSDEGVLHVKDITEDLNLSISFITEMKEQGNPLPRRAFTSSLLNRWVGMNILVRKGRGIYTWNKKYENLYEKDVETPGYLEIESSPTTNDIKSKKENQNISRPWLD